MLACALCLWRCVTVHRGRGTVCRVGARLSSLARPVLRYWECLALVSALTARTAVENVVLGTQGSHSRMLTALACWSTWSSPHSHIHQYPRIQQLQPV